MTQAQSTGIPVGDVELRADVALPSPARRIVVFAHGSGSGRLSPRNRAVASELQLAELGTVLVDLLTHSEESVDARTAELRFDIDPLAERLVGVIDWIGGQSAASDADVGVFGASTGAAAAVVAAVARPDAVKAVVSRGGRVDLAGGVLRSVRQPTLLIVGGRDDVVIDLNRDAMRLLAGEARLEIVPGASHLFEEPGALEHVSRLARDWFVQHLQ